MAVKSDQKAGNTDVTSHRRFQIEEKQNKMKKMTQVRESLDMEDRNENLKG